MAARFKNYRQTQNSNIDTPYSIGNFVALSPNKYAPDQTPMAAFKASSLVKQNPIANSTINQKVMVEQIKKVRAEYQIRILQLQNEVDYKQQVHQRQLENQKALMQFQYTAKMRDIKSSLRQQYIGHLNQNLNIKQKNKQLQEQIRLLKLRYQRAQKYSKQIQKIISDQKNKKQQQIQKIKKQLLNSIDQDNKNKQKIKQIEQQLQQLTIKVDKQKEQKNQLQQKNKKLLQKIQTLQKSVDDVTKKLRLEVVQRQQIRIQKDNVIDQLKARLEALRQQTISQEIAFKKKIRQNKLAQIDQNLSQQYQNSGRKSMKTIDIYRFDVQRQIILEKQMKKKFQFDFNNHTQSILSKTQPLIQNLRAPQIKKVNKTTKRNASTDVTDFSARKDSIPDSPQFGFKI